MTKHRVTLSPSGIPDEGSDVAAHVIDRYVFVKAENKFLDLLSMALITPKEFDALWTDKLQPWLQV